MFRAGPEAVTVAELAIRAFVEHYGLTGYYSQRYVLGFEGEAYWLTPAGEAALNDRPLTADEWWKTPAFEAEVRERGDGPPPIPFY